jgi:ABC-type xylose transport system substrate-binding protein
LSHFSLLQEKNVMNSKYWKLLVSMMALLAIVALASCAGATTPAPAPTTAPTTSEEPAEPTEPEVPAEDVGGKVGIVLPTRDEPRWVQDETRFREALEAAGYEVEILFSQGDSSRERANVDDLITKGVQVLIITPHDGTAAAAAANAAKEAGVSVISYDRLIRDTDAVDFYVTFDSKAVGRNKRNIW